MKIVSKGCLFVLENGTVRIDGWQFDCEGAAVDFADLVDLVRRTAVVDKLRNASFALAEVVLCRPDVGDDFDSLIVQAQQAIELASKMASRP